MIGNGMPIYVALEAQDMRQGSERLGALVRGSMGHATGARALFVFVGKSGHSMKILTWDSSGTIVVHKKLDSGRFELPRATSADETHMAVSDAMFDVIFKGAAKSRRNKLQQMH